MSNSFATLFKNAEGSTMVLTIPMRLNDQLALGATIPSSVLMTDPPRYVGEVYDSAYLYNSDGFAYTTTSAAMVVDLTYEPSSNAALEMWSVSGSLRSLGSRGRQSIVLPAGHSDTLLVGQGHDGGRLAQDAAFTLTTRAATPEESVSQTNLQIASFSIGPYDVNASDYILHLSLTLRETTGVNDATIKSIEFYAAPDAPRATLTGDYCLQSTTVSAGQTWVLDTGLTGCSDFKSVVLPSGLSVTVHYADAMGRTAAGLLALLVAAVGLYSVMAYLVADQTHEIGVRLALGARGSDIASLILRGSVGMAAVGVALGGAVALVASRRVESLLFNGSPRDPLVYGGVAITLLAVAICAGVVPMMRARRIDAMVALRAD